MFIYTLLIDLSRKIGSGSKNCRIGTLATLPKLTRTSNCTRSKYLEQLAAFILVDRHIVMVIDLCKS